MDDKKQLKFILEVLKSIPHSKDNKWFWDGVSAQSLIPSDVNTSTEFHNYQKYKIDSIYEETIKTIIRHQAEMFYKDFQILEIKKRLSEDFVRMEHFRRIDNFEDFCLAAFQQIECIVNYILKKYDNSIYERFLLEKDELFLTYVNYKNNERSKTGSITLMDVISLYTKNNEFRKFLSENRLINWSFNYRLRIIIYYFLFDGCVEKEQKSEFDNLCKIGYYLYSCRNLNHRESNPSESQEASTNNILKLKHQYYLIFQGFLGSFLKKIKNNGGKLV